MEQILQQRYISARNKRNVLTVAAM